MDKKQSKSCCSKFPILPAVILIIGVLWLLKDLGVLGFSLPWLPIIIIIASLGMFCHKPNQC